MLVNRIIGAFTFRRQVYADVEKDTAFTTTAWILVVVIAFLNQLGAYPSLENPVNWLVSALLGTVLAVIGFALAALVISWVGRVVFGAKTSFGEMTRVLGLAYVWGIVGVIGILVILAPTTLQCILAPVLFIAAVLSLLAWFVAVKEALDLDWIRTIVTVILGWIVMLVINIIIGGIVLGTLGLTAAGMGALTG